MPRITLYSRPAPLTEWSGTNVDYCTLCLPSDEDAHKLAQMVDLDVYHPDYAEFGDYECHACGIALTEEDN